MYIYIYISLSLSTILIYIYIYILPALTSEVFSEKTQKKRAAGWPFRESTEAPRPSPGDRVAMVRYCGHTFPDDPKVKSSSLGQFCKSWPNLE